MSRPLEPVPGSDRLSRVEDLEEEYASAAVVALPLRMGSGLRRRAVEALVRGKVLCTTSVGARGIDLARSQAGIVADDPIDLAAGIVRVLRSEDLRCEMEERARRLALDAFSPERMIDALAATLDLPLPAPSTDTADAVGVHGMQEEPAF
jgi:glycosyltransferase involved in cell wall biosynthesis